eukprot:tig00000663_g2982.t1
MYLAFATPSLLRTASAFMISIPRILESTSTVQTQRLSENTALTLVPETRIETRTETRTYGLYLFTRDGPGAPFQPATVDVNIAENIGPAVAHAADQVAAAAQEEARVEEDAPGFSLDQPSPEQLNGTPHPAANLVSGPGGRDPHSAPASPYGEPIQEAAPTFQPAAGPSKPHEQLKYELFGTPSSQASEHSVVDLVSPELQSEPRSPDADEIVASWRQEQAAEKERRQAKRRRD